MLRLYVVLQTNLVVLSYLSVFFILVQVCALMFFVRLENGYVTDGSIFSCALDETREVKIK